MNRCLFNILLCCCIVLSFLLGKYHLIITDSETIRLIVNIIIFCIFFTCGIMIPLDQLDSIQKYIHLTSFTLFCSFIIYPFIGITIGYFMTLINFNKNLLLGFVMVCFMPPPISAGVILTQGIGGNEPAAIMNSIVGNFFGIVLSPLLLHKFLLNAVDVPKQDLFETVSHIFVIIILPLALGKVLSKKLRQLLSYTNYQNQISNFNKILLLCILFMSFLDMFQHQDWLSFGLRSVFLVIFSIVLCQSMMILFVYVFGAYFMIDSADSKDMYAVVYSSSLKSLSTGMVIIHSLLSSSGDFALAVNRAEITLPLMLFEPIQIIVGSSLQPAITQLFINFRNNSTIINDCQLENQP